MITHYKMIIYMFIIGAFCIQGSLLKASAKQLDEQIERDAKKQEALLRLKAAENALKAAENDLKKFEKKYKLTKLFAVLPVIYFAKNLYDAVAYEKVIDKMPLSLEEKAFCKRYYLMLSLTDVPSFVDLMQKLKEDNTLSSEKKEEQIKHYLFTHMRYSKIINLLSPFLAVIICVFGPELLS